MVGGDEYNSLMKHNSWNLVELSPGKKPIKCEWVYKRKIVGDTEIYKAHLVANGSTKKKGIDYNKVYTGIQLFDNKTISGC